jgi:uncharacterized protein YjiS (DUF1127 family)
MDRSPIAPVTTLSPGRFLREHAPGTRLSVLHGKVWVTQDGDPADRVLVEGDDFVFDRAGLSLITALEEEAQVAITPPAPGKASLWSRLHRARRAALDRARLHEMQDRELRDIGLCRSQIDALT